MAAARRCLLCACILCAAAIPARTDDAPSAEQAAAIVATTRAAVADLAATYGRSYPGAQRALADLSGLADRIARAETSADASALVDDARALQRRVFVESPLLAARTLVFVMRPQYIPDHHNTETMFQTGEIAAASFRGGGALRAITFGPTDTVRTLVDVPEGIARDPEVSPTGDRVVFSMRRSPTDDYHIYEIAADGSGLRQLTYGAGLTDIDPFYLPDGRIAFTSTREPKYCMCNRHVMGNLFRMESDGANILQIGKSTLFEGHGCVMPDGRILYDRWEYVDRNFGDAQGLWTCRPDGTDHALFWGNNTPSPGAVLDARPIPGTGRVVATFSSCHDRPWGALAIVDPALGTDGREPVVRTWPASAIDLVMHGDFDMFKVVEPKYEDPYPLSDRYFLCSRMTGEGERMGLYLVDVFGNEVLLHVEGPGCFDPIPLQPHQAAPVTPDRVRLDASEGVIYLTGAQRGTGMERVALGAARYVRVVESPEKRFWTPSAWLGQGQEAPAMDWHDFNNKRIIGTVPLEPDGSAYFAVPADRFIYFQLLDENGMMIQSMRSGTIVRPGETLGCAGCHESRLASAPNRDVAAMHAPPKRLQPWYGPEREYGYVTEVQPVWDRYCVRCHDYGQPAGEKLNLAGDLGLSFCVSYTELWRKGLVGAIGAGPAETQPPYSWGSHTSRLVKTLREGHYGVEIDRESWDRVVTWIDVNGPYYPTYASAYMDNLYGRCPLSNAELARLKELTGVDLLDGDNQQVEETWVSFTRPDISPLLARAGAEGDPKREEALAIISAGAKRLAERPRGDTRGMPLDGLELARERKYEERAAREREAREAALSGRKVYPYRPG